MKEKEIIIVMKYMKQYFKIFNQLYKEFITKQSQFIQTVQRMSQSQQNLSMSQELYSQRDEIQKEKDNIKSLMNENKEFFEFIKTFIFTNENEENEIINKNEKKIKGELMKLILKLIDVKEYNSMINQYEYYLFINEIKKQKEIINDILLILNKNLKKMSLRYYILPAILSNCNTKIYSKCKLILLKNCHMRREFIKQNIDILNEDQIYALLPEYSIQHLIHYYGYNDELNNENIEEMSKIMMFMIENIIENNSEGISIIQHQLNIIKLSNDNLLKSLNLIQNELFINKLNKLNKLNEEEKEIKMNEYQKRINERIYSTCLISGMILNESSKNKKYKPKEEKGSIIKMLFILREKDEIIESIIPFGYQIPKKNLLFFNNSLNIKKRKENLNTLNNLENDEEKKEEGNEKKKNEKYQRMKK